MEQTIILTLDEKVKDFMAMPSGPLKNYKFTRLMYSQGTEANIAYKDGHMYYSSTMYKVTRSKHGYFYKVISKDGFTLDPKGKLQIWYGKNVKKIPHLVAVIHKLGNDWFEDQFVHFLTKGVLEKILTRKVTNPLGFFEAWLKAQRIKASPRLIFKALKTYSAGQLYMMILKYHTVIEHMDQLLIKMIEQGKKGTTLSSTFIDLLDQAIIMEVKVDPKWSDKRCEAEHHNLTQQLMEMQLDSIDSTSIENLEEIKELIDSEYITLLDNERSVFAEGKIMSHCIYTNYWSRIKSKTMLCLHVNYNGHRGTLTLKPEPGIGKLQFSIYDFKDKRNREPHSLAKNYVDNWLYKFNARLFINHVSFTPTEKQEVNIFTYEDPLPF